MRKLVDQERRKSRELAEANARLARLDRLKRDFLAFISHELRTPLNHMAAVDLFDADASPEEQAEIAAIVREGYTRLDQFIRAGLEYFDWSSREPGSDAGCPCDWRESLDAAAAEFRELTVAVQCDQPASAVRADPERLRRVFRVLLHNAVKHGGGGEVTVRGCVDGDLLRIEIADRGPGIAAAMAEEVFRPFTILESRSHSEGTGLSLALARAMLAPLGGSISVARTAGPGATIAVSLRLVTPAHKGENS